MWRELQQTHCCRRASVEPRQPTVRRLGVFGRVGRPDERIPFGERHAERPDQPGELAIESWDLLPVHVPQLWRRPRLNQHAALVLHDDEILIELSEERLPAADGRQHLVTQRRQPVHSLDVRTQMPRHGPGILEDRKSTRLNSSHLGISYAVFCLKKKKKKRKKNNKLL